MNRDETKTFDVRLIDRNIRRGLISRKDFDKHIKALPDATDKSMPYRPDFSAIDDDDFDDDTDATA